MLKKGSEISYLVLREGDKQADKLNMATIDFKKLNCLLLLSQYN